MASKSAAKSKTKTPPAKKPAPKPVRQARRQPQGRACRKAADGREAGRCGAEASTAKTPGGKPVHRQGRR